MPMAIGWPIMFGSAWRHILSSLVAWSRRSVMGCFLLAAMSLPADANKKIENPIAVFAGLDKITATITTFEVPVNKTKQFGTL